MQLERVKSVSSAKFGELPIQEKGATFRPAGTERKTKPGDVPENTGYTESYIGAELKMKVNAKFKDEFTLEAISSVVDDTLTIITTEGKQYMMPQAWTMKPSELGDGEMEIIYNSGSSPRLK